MPGNARSPLLELPQEVLLEVLLLLSPNDIVSIRQSCSRFYAISLDTTLWTDIAIHLSTSLPLPSLDRIKSSNLLELEYAAVRATKVEEQWLRPRPASPRKISASYTPGNLDYLELFENRFVITVYCTPCVVLLWDLDGLQLREDTRQLEWGRIVGEWKYIEEGHPLAMIAFNSCRARFCESTREIFVSFFVVLGTQTILHVISCNVSGNPAQKRPFRVVARFTEDNGTIAPPTSFDIKLTSTAHCKTNPETITINNWKESSRLITHIESNDQELNLVDWLDVEFFDPYVIAVKTSTVHIFAVPINIPGNELIHQKLIRLGTLQLPGRSVRGGLFSHRRANTAHDASFIVTLIVSDAFNFVSHYSINLPHNPHDTECMFSCTATLSDLDVSLKERNVWASEVTLGSRGMRGAWIEKSRLNMERRVIAFTANEDHAIRSHQVFRTSSPNMADDLTRIACDEVTGRIVLGTRGGELWLLDCWKRAPKERNPLARFEHRRTAN